MDSEEEKTEIDESSQSFLIPRYVSNLDLFLTENTASLVQRSCKQSRTSSHVAERRFSGSVPLDLAWEILSRLPAKSIVRSRAVSKLWSSIITNPDFITLSSASRPCVLLTFQKGETLSVFSFPQHQNPSDPYSQVERYEMINPNDRHVACSDSVHGLICLETSQQLVIWNPTLRRFLTLLEHENGLKCVRGFLGYDPVECKYKVQSFLTDEGIRVLTLGAQESWRMTKVSPIYCPTPATGYARCINGIMYFKAAFGLPLKHVIMSFDLRFETFNLIEYPMDDHSRGLMVSYEGKLALVSSTKSGAEIWILEDEEKQKWLYKQIFYPLSETDWMCLDLKGVNDGGELVYTPRSLYESFHVVYFELKRNYV